MTDRCDIAGDTILECTAEAERRARGKSGPETHADFDGHHCVDCEDLIPDARLVLGRVRCIDCQRLLERVLNL